MMNVLENESEIEALLTKIDPFNNKRMTTTQMMTKKVFLLQGVQDALTSMKACNLVLTSIHPIGDPIVKPWYDSIFS